MKRFWDFIKTEKSAIDPKGQEEEIMSEELVATLGETVPSVENNVTVSIVDKQIAVFKFGVTPDQIELAQALDSESAVIRNRDGDVVFSISAGDKTELSAAGLILSDKRDFVLQRDKPLTEQEITKEYGAAIIKTNAVIAKIKHTIAGSADDLAGKFKAVNL